MFPTNPLVSKLICQLAPAALVSAVGIVLLSSLTKPAFTPPPIAAPALPTLQTEAVFTPMPRVADPEPVQFTEQPAVPAGARPVAPLVKPKLQQHKLAATEVPLPPARQQPVPATTVPPMTPAIAAQPPATPPNNRTMMGRLWDMTASVTSIPGRAYSRVTGWFAYETPPRPPRDVPAQDSNATM